jgi:hypothetical protein
MWYRTNALWYFPVIITVSGLVTLVWDSTFIRRGVEVLRSQRRTVEDDAEMTAHISHDERAMNGSTEDRTEEEREGVVPSERELIVSWKLGVIVIATFFASFIAVMVARGVVTFKPLLFVLFSNMYLAGTIIVRGGPVVYPSASRSSDRHARDVGAEDANGSVGPLSLRGGGHHEISC